MSNYDWFNDRPGTGFIDTSHSKEFEALQREVDQLRKELRELQGAKRYDIVLVKEYRWQVDALNAEEALKWYEANGDTIMPISSTVVTLGVENASPSDR